MRLQHVSVSRQPQRDKRTRQFYRELLGLSEIPVPKSLQHLNLIWFQLDADTELHLFIENDIDSSSNRHFCLVVDKIQPIRTTLEEANYDVWDVEEIPGRPRFFVRDPSNNIVEISAIDANYLTAQVGDHAKVGAKA
jgi:catechol 2,3-dioxygenase-like lactoylglutathione lyase family enzyme